MALTPETSDSGTTMESTRFIQEPIAVVSMACRLPGHSDSPQKLWEFLMQDGVADTAVPESRFNLKAFYDGSDRPRTLRSPGAMFMEYVDPAAFDAPFFNISPQEATAMDPQQRILLEVIYEALENAGLPLESLAGEKYGCFVGGHTGGLQLLHSY
jgi:acyl transferase domain-containing protein